YPCTLALNHGRPGGLAVVGIKEIAAQHIERSLRGMPADAFAIAGKAQGAVTAAIGVGKSDVNQAYRLLRGTAGGPGDPGDADAERRADAAADSLREGLGHLGADGALGFNQLGRPIRPGGLQIIAEANR